MATTDHPNDGHRSSEERPSRLTVKRIYRIRISSGSVLFMKSDIDIAQDARMEPISATASRIGLSKDDIKPYGHYIAKVPLDVLGRFDDRPNGKLVLVTAITATKAGEGKTVTSIGLMEGLGKLGINVMGALREPSMGPVFGVKGGATGGGRAQSTRCGISISFHWRYTCSYGCAQYFISNAREQPRERQ